MVRSQKTSHFLQYHHAITIGTQLLTTVGAKRDWFHMRQGEIDGACGLHVTSMALILLGMLKPTAAVNMASRKLGLPAKLFKAFRDSYFSGIQPRQLTQAITDLELALTVTGRYKGQAGIEKFAVENLKSGGLVILSFRSVLTRKTHHYALAVGLGGEQAGNKRAVSMVLLLDPGADPLPYSPCNAVLRLSDNKSRTALEAAMERPRARDSPAVRARPINWLYESSFWNPELVRLTAAIAVDPA